MDKGQEDRDHQFDRRNRKQYNDNEPTLEGRRDTHGRRGEHLDCTLFNTKQNQSEGTDIDSVTTSHADKGQYPGDYRQWVEEPMYSTLPEGSNLDEDRSIWNENNSLMFRPPKTSDRTLPPPDTLP